MTVQTEKRIPTTTSRGEKNRRNNWRSDEAVSRFTFLMPAVLLILILSIFPLFFSLILSFFSWDLSRLEGGAIFTGLNNFRTMLGDARFVNTARVTLIFVVGGVMLQFCLGLLLASILNRELRFQRFFRVSFLIPMMLTPTAVAYTGRMLFNESIGPVNDLIKHLGGPVVPWLSSASLALPTLILVDTWEWTPFVMIVLLAGLQSLPPEIFEAARVDGADRMQIFRRITLPMLMPVSVTVILIRALEAFKQFDIIAVMTGGGPGTSTESVTMYVYVVGMKNGNLGYASALAYSLLVMIVIFSTVFLRTFRPAADNPDQR